MKRRPAVPVLTISGLLLAAPAQAATLSVDRQCYRERQPVTLLGAGFTPNGRVNVARDGAFFGTLGSDAAGNVRGIGPAPVIDPSRERRFSLTAVDVANPALTGVVTPLATILDVKVRPTGVTPTRVRTITARGFAGDRTLYVHVRRGRYRRTVKLGRLKQPCGTKVVRARIFTAGARTGVYRVQFDSRRKYSGKTSPNVHFRVTIYRIRARAGAGVASVRERWTPSP